MGSVRDSGCELRRFHGKYAEYWLRIRGVLVSIDSVLLNFPTA